MTPVLNWELWGRAYLLFVKIAGEILPGLAGLKESLDSALSNDDRDTLVSSAQEIRESLPVHCEEPASCARQPESVSKAFGCLLKRDSLVTQPLLGFG